MLPGNRARALREAPSGSPPAALEHLHPLCEDSLLCVPDTLPFSSFKLVSTTGTQRKTAASAVVLFIYTTYTSANKGADTLLTRRGASEETRGHTAVLRVPSLAPGPWSNLSLHLLFYSAAPCGVRFPRHDLAKEQAGAGGPH